MNGKKNNKMIKNNKLAHNWIMKNKNLSKDAITFTSPFFTIPNGERYIPLHLLGNKIVIYDTFFENIKHLTKAYIIIFDTRNIKTFTNPFAEAIIPINKIDQRISKIPPEFINKDSKFRDIHIHWVKLKHQIYLKKVSPKLWQKYENVCKEKGFIPEVLIENFIKEKIQEA